MSRKRIPFVPRPPEPPKQLEFPELSEGRLREALFWVLENECDGITLDTRERDYRVRIDWLLQMFGDVELTELEGRKGYERMRAAWKACEGTIRNVTVKKRFKFMLRALRLAAARDLIAKDRIPVIPKMENDEQPRRLHLTLEQYRQLRHAVPTAWHRMYLDIGFWTGMHRNDIEGTLWSHLDLDRPICDAHGHEVGRGMWLMRNTKSKLSGTWLPMDDEFRLCVTEFLHIRPGPPDAPVVGVSIRPRQWLRPACDRAGLPHIQIPHLRRSRAKYLEDCGADLLMIRYQLGHVGVNLNITTKHYLGSTPGPGSLVRMLDLAKGPARRPVPTGPTVRHLSADSSTKM